MFGNKSKNELAAMKAEVDSAKGLMGALEKSMAVVELDLDGRILRANDNFLTAMGYRAEELSGKSHATSASLKWHAVVDMPIYGHRCGQVNSYQAPSSVSAKPGKVSG